MSASFYNDAEKNASVTRRKKSRMSVLNYHPTKSERDKRHSRLPEAR
jgi:hypothetical protein